MKNWREVLKRERSGQYPAQPPVDLFRYRQGVYYRTHDGAETPEAIRRVEAFRHALLTIPVLLAEEQEFYGGVELFRRAELPPEIEAADYAEAIRYAIEHAQEGDVIVLAGKGHEDYQEICGKKYHMDERELVADVVKDGNFLQ